MRIIINDKTYELSEKDTEALIAQLSRMAITEYKKLDQKYRVLAKFPAREILKHFEMITAEKYGKEKSLIYRPAKKSDPVMHLAHVFEWLAKEASKHVTIGFETADTFATNFSLTIKQDTSESG